MAVFIIAEVGMLHEGSLGLARCLVDAAYGCGANAIKFQTHIAEEETLKDAPAPSYFQNEPRFDYFKRTAFSVDQWKELKVYCDNKGIEFLSSPFSIKAVELLHSIGMSIFKVPSGEVTNIPYLEKISKVAESILLSSGMSNWIELDEAVQAIQKHNKNITVLQCTSAYPCPYESVGLNILSELKERYKLPFGLSDHTLTNFASYAATTLGASVIEKHLTLSRLSYGSDAKHSLEPDEFQQLVEGIRAIEKMQHNPVDKNNLSKLGQMKLIFQKSLVTACSIQAGTVIESHMIAFKKPGGGIPPKNLNQVIGRRVKRFLPADAVLSEGDLEGTLHG